MIFFSSDFGCKLGRPCACPPFSLPPCPSPLFLSFIELTCFYFHVFDVCAEIEEECAAHHCADLKAIYDDCATRLAADPNKKDSDNCEGQYFDFLHCVDHCVRLRVDTFDRDLCGLFFFFNFCLPDPNTTDRRRR